jgi:ribonuclease P protein component
MAAIFTLGKQERLKSKKLIDQLFNKGKGFSIFPFRVLLDFSEKDRDNTDSHLRFGVAVSSRHFKKAVDRNKVKRLTREAYRIQKNELLELLRSNDRQLNVFFIYTGKEIPDLENLKEKVNLVIIKLISIVHEKVAANT